MRLLEWTAFKNLDALTNPNFVSHVCILGGSLPPVDMPLPSVAWESHGREKQDWREQDGSLGPQVTCRFYNKIIFFTFKNFMHVYNVSWLYPSSLPFPTSPKTSPSQCYVLFFTIFITYWLQLVLSMCHVRTIHWGMGNLSLATALKKKWFSVPPQPSNPPIALQLGLGPLLPTVSCSERGPFLK